ncbi:Bug family tripartite tricarboxylate transporter substrate binding protein [Roseococcus pinisoli]|uniref:Tripartite tricarboxylate transporter substrate binding protein n=1 Tax=Roseococcus pinisoli TaxID=2835040 RepID=A0ABS5Q951_9PROT|nr:tripartite tricarboxylate transporter substrate binding protein [Roseococcus pinisoli]MBS7810222.1 tripartite tricarboxylate transporter substrate binding protein [Roseococcus pinisoli]
MASFTTARRALLATALAAPSLARAQAAYPERPIRLIVPFPPGGGTDAISREVGARMLAVAGWTVVPENRPGAGGNIGLDAVAKAPADGYTIGMGQCANLAVNPALYPNLPFDGLRDFAFISLLAMQPLVLVVARTSPWQTMQDLAAAIRSSPEPLKAGHPGNGTLAHLSSELLAQRLGKEVLVVPYRGAGAVTADLLAGRVDFYFSSPPPVRGLIESGELRAVAVTTAERSPALPEVPTMIEAGYENFLAVNWTGLVAPARTPAEIVARWNTEVRRGLETPEMLARLRQDFSVPHGSTSAEFRRFVEAEVTKWGEVVRSARIQLG